MNAYNVAADKENKSEHIPKFNKKVEKGKSFLEKI